MLPRLPDVTPNEFFAVDVRVGRIIAVEAFPEARKPAWKLTVDFGPDIGELRTSAQVTNYAQDDLVGRLVVAAVNLGEKRIAGFTSQCLVLGAVADDGVVHLLEVPAHLEPGTRIA
jgi:tRNA-binding protein